MTVQVTDPLAQEDMAGLAAASAAVLRGKVVEAEDGVDLGGSQMRYTAYTVEVDEPLAGRPGDRLRVIVSSQVDGHDVVIHGRPLPAVGDEGIWFLSPIPPRFDDDGYVLTGLSGLLVFDGDEVAGGGPHGSPVRTEVDRLGSPEAVVGHVRSVAD